MDPRSCAGRPGAAGGCCGGEHGKMGLRVFSYQCSWKKNTNMLDKQSGNMASVVGFDDDAGGLLDGG